VVQALRGMALMAAATLAAQLGDINRFANPHQLMAYLGPVPSEHSSGGTRRQGGITKAATTHPNLGKAGGAVTARRTLVSTTSRISFDAGS
jgi:transposase